MEKVQLPNQPPAAPMPVVIAGALVKGKENYLAIGAYGVMSMQPPLVYISSMKAHFTNAGIKETGYFSINVPSAGLVKETDYCGLVSGRDTDKSRVFSAFYGKEKHAPLIRGMPGKCRLQSGKNPGVSHQRGLHRRSCRILRRQDLPYGKHTRCKKDRPAAARRPHVPQTGRRCRHGFFRGKSPHEKTLIFFAGCTFTTLLQGNHDGEVSIMKKFGW